MILILAAHIRGNWIMRWRLLISRRMMCSAAPEMAR